MINILFLVLIDETNLKKRKKKKSFINKWLVI